MFRRRGQIVRMDEFEDVDTVQRSGRMIENTLDGRGCVGDRAIAVDQNNEVRSVFDQRCEPGLRRRKLVLNRSQVADVAGDDRDRLALAGVVEVGDEHDRDRHELAVDPAKGQLTFPTAAVVHGRQPGGDELRLGVFVEMVDEWRPGGSLGKKSVHRFVEPDQRCAVG